MFATRRTFRMAGLVTLSLFTLACAKDPDNISANYVSPVQYRSYDCDQLSAEAGRLSARLSEATGAQEDAQTRDAVAMGVGLVLFWPALFFLAAGDSSAELGRLKGEFEAVEKEAVRQDCNLADAIREAREAAAEKREQEDAEELEEMRAEVGPMHARN